MTINKKSGQPLADANISASFEFEIDLDELGLPRRLKVQGEPHEQEAINSAIKTALEGVRNPGLPISMHDLENVPKPHSVVPSPQLKDLVDLFLDRYSKTGSPAMLKKHNMVLPMLVDVVGNQSVADLKQAHINEFFDIVCSLPRRWKDVCRQRNLTIREVALLEHEETLGPKSFEDTYIASVRPFLKAAKKDWQDQGFPLGLTTEGIEYLGEREEDENKQRSFTLEELRKLFQGNEMRSIAGDRNLGHCYWLAHIGLFTGARVNEICQLNPQTDILQDQSGIWYFWITAETEACEGIIKSVKTGEARKVPIHQTLLELGLLDYVKRIKSAGAKRLFPDWGPVRNRASGNAEKWFRQFLRDTDLRDETPKRKILGMHAFRHTILTHGILQKPSLNLTPITGHAQNIEGIGGVAKGYLDMMLINSIIDLKVLIDQLQYDVEFYKPS